jgi:hypothetical protein
VGGTIVDHAGIPVDFWFGSVLAILGLVTLASFRTRNNAGQAAVSVASTEVQTECV